MTPLMPPNELVTPRKLELFPTTNEVIPTSPAPSRLSRGLDKALFDVDAKNMHSEPNKVNADRVCAIVEQRFEELDDIEMDLAIEAAGVAQAVDALRKALDLVEDRLKERKYETVANLGYRDVASEFIFLQRTMGSLLTAAHARQYFISEIAGEARLSYEVVKPLVEEEIRRRQLQDDKRESS